MTGTAQRFFYMTCTALRLLRNTQWTILNLEPTTTHYEVIVVDNLNFTRSVIFTFEREFLDLQSYV